MQLKKDYSSKKYSLIKSFRIMAYDINEKIREKLKI
jgi:hypothetical protein